MGVPARASNHQHDVAVQLRTATRARAAPAGGHEGSNVQRMVRLESVLVCSFARFGTRHRDWRFPTLLTGWVLIRSISRLSEDVELATNWALGRVAFVLVVCVPLGIMTAGVPPAGQPGSTCWSRFRQREKRERSCYGVNRIETVRGGPYCLSYGSCGPGLGSP